MSVPRPTCRYPASRFRRPPVGSALALVPLWRLGREFAGSPHSLVEVPVAYFDRARCQGVVLGRGWRSRFSDDRSDERVSRDASQCEKKTVGYLDPMFDHCLCVLLTVPVQRHLREEWDVRRRLDEKGWSRRHQRFKKRLWASLRCGSDRHTRKYPRHV